MRCHAVADCASQRRQASHARPGHYCEDREKTVPDMKPMRDGEDKDAKVKLIAHLANAASWDAWYLHCAFSLAGNDNAWPLAPLSPHTAT
jgi:hypothetical protein